MSAPKNVGGAQPPRNAATVLVIRDSTEGPEVFMVRRHQKSGFMGGAFVFPGGKVDAADKSGEVLGQLQLPDETTLASQLHEGLDEANAAALFVAAARETLEEAGIWLGNSRSAAPPGLRESLLAGRALGPLLVKMSLTLDLTSLVSWSRWVTPVVESRRFDTRFFLARVGAHVSGHHDEVETTESEWMTPKRALSRFEKGEILLPPPTMRSLWLLRGFDSASEMLSSARKERSPLVDPLFVELDGVKSLVLPGHPKHPRDRRAIPGAYRFVHQDGRWWDESIGSESAV